MKPEKFEDMKPITREEFDARDLPVEYMHMPELSDVLLGFVIGGVKYVNAKAATTNEIVTTLHEKD